MEREMGGESFWDSLHQIRAVPNGTAFSQILHHSNVFITQAIFITQAFLSLKRFSEFFHDRSLRQSRVHVWTALQQSFLRLIRGHRPVLHQPTQCDRCASCSTGFAVDVDDFPLGGVLLDKFNCFDDVLQFGMRKVGRGNV